MNRPSRSRVRRLAKNATVLPKSTLSVTMHAGFQRTDKPDSVVFSKDRMLKGQVVLELTNNSYHNWLAYKIKTTYNPLIRIVPARGILEPEGIINVRLTADISKLEQHLDTNPIVVVIFAVSFEDELEDAIEAWRHVENNPGTPMWKKQLPVFVSEEEEDESPGGNEEMMEEEDESPSGNEEIMEDGKVDEEEGMSVF